VGSGLKDKTRERRRRLALFSDRFFFSIGLWTFGEKEKEQEYEKEMAD
jgi:hypothetical protein